MRFFHIQPALTPPLGGGALLSEHCRNV